MKSKMKDLGMKAIFIYACVNNCILYWKDNEDKEECPQCGESRYTMTMRKRGSLRKEPKKILNLIPRLFRLYTIPWIAGGITWHH